MSLCKVRMLERRQWRSCLSAFTVLILDATVPFSLMPAEDCCWDLLKGSDMEDFFSRWIGYSYKYDARSGFFNPKATTISVKRKTRRLFNNHAEFPIWSDETNDGYSIIECHYRTVTESNDGYSITTWSFPKRQKKSHCGNHPPTTKEQKKGISAMAFYYI